MNVQGCITYLYLRSQEPGGYEVSEKKKYCLKEIQSEKVLGIIEFFMLMGNVYLYNRNYVIGIFNITNR